MKDGKILIITDCNKCPYSNTNYCEVERKHIYDYEYEDYNFGEFPKWCPLEDTEV